MTIAVLDRLSPELSPAERAEQTKKYRELCIVVVEGKITDENSIFEILPDTGRTVEQLKADCEKLEARKAAQADKAALAPPDVARENSRLAAIPGERQKLIDK